MATISSRTFGGEIPRSTADRLPEERAQQAINCDFAYGELRPMKGLFQITRLANSAKSLFSLDGITFLSWPYRTKAWKGPVTNDIFDRMYFTGENGGLRVAQTWRASVSGGEPAVSYKAGVPQVAAAPTYVLQDRTSLPDYPAAAVKLYSYYETDGKRYDEREITSFTTVVPFREFTFALAGPSAGNNSLNSLSTELRTVKLSSLTYGDGETASIGGQYAYIVDASTVVVGGTIYSSVSSITPETGITTSPGAFLADRQDQIGGVTPTSASPGVRIDVVDTAKNETIFSLSASSTVASNQSDAVPGGVEARLIKDGTDAGRWKLSLQYGVSSARAYVITMVNDWNEESKPSPPVIVQPTYMQTVRLTFTPPSFDGYVPANRFRLYRSVNSGDYISCTATPQSFTGSPVSFTDAAITVKETDGVLESTGWDEPPAGLRGLTLMPNGFFAGFVGDTLYFSEPFRPWAWPYATSFPVAIIGMRAIENSLVVTTRTFPYVVNGVHPEAMTPTQLTHSQAGVSDHGMCVVGSTVAYISNDGIAVVSGLEVNLSISQQLWTREKWRERFASVLGDLELAYHDGSLVCGTSTAGKMWEIRLDSEGGGHLTMFDTLTANALYVLPVSDQLYIAQGQNLLQYKGGSTPFTYDWWSKDIFKPRPVQLNAGYVNTDGPVTVSVYLDGALLHQQSFTQASYFRLPSGKKGLKWSFRLQGTGTVKELSLASRKSELANV